MVWYSHLFNNFPVFCDPRSFSVINEADFFFNSLDFSMILLMLVIRSLVPLPFLNPACTYGSSIFHEVESDWQPIKLPRDIFLLKATFTAMLGDGIGNATEWKEETAASPKHQVQVINAFQRGTQPAFLAAHPSALEVNAKPFHPLPVFYTIINQPRYHLG